MNAQKSFADLALAAASMADQFTTQCAELSNAQQLLVKQFDNGRKGLQAQIANAEQARQVAVGQVNKAFADKRDEINDQIKELQKAFDDECIKIGLKKEAVPLADYQAVQVMDKGALQVTKGIAHTTSYVKNLWARANKG